MGSTTEFMPEETVDKFLATPAPTVFFALTGDNCGVMLVQPTQRYDETMKTNVPVPGLWVNFDPWTGPGSEMIDPTDPAGTRPRFRWGVVDLTKFAKDTEYDADTLVARMDAQCERLPLLFRSCAGTQLELRREYGHIKSQLRIDEQYQKERAKLTAPQRAAGEPVPVAVGAE
ncbi:hypothetical protein LCGC14_1886860 [marine sediment metagenome]|uniref:Uncharacterized protein n=1 Tax=marine sediment metagenome TaxID=412755 RepID=A0A0F9GNY7_9ZZZZ